MSVKQMVIIGVAAVVGIILLWRAAAHFGWVKNPFAGVSKTRVDIRSTVGQLQSIGELASLACPFQTIQVLEKTWMGSTAKGIYIMRTTGKLGVNLYDVKGTAEAVDGHAVIVLHMPRIRMIGFVPDPDRPFQTYDERRGVFSAITNAERDEVWNRTFKAQEAEG